MVKSVANLSNCPSCNFRFQMEQVATILSPDSEYIDWRTFMLQIANPWPQPSQAQLLVTLQRFKEVDTLGMGTVTREQFEQVGELGI